MATVIIVFLGQNRFFSVFEKELKKIRSAGQSNLIIYYQYDTGSLSLSEIKILKKYNVILREVKEVCDEQLKEFDPSLLDREGSELRKFGGGLRRATIWRQLIDLKSFLNFINDDFSNDSFIIRMRPDYAMTETFYKQLSYEPEKLFPDAKDSEVFYKKIWVMWASATIPFYLHDAVFGGTLLDMNKLIDDDNNISLNSYYPCYGLPILFFVRPFVENSHIGEALKILTRTPFKYELLSDPKYRSALSEYHQILSNSFNVKFFDSRWHVQWLNGKGVKRIWIPFNNSWTFKIFPQLLSTDYLGPFALEKNKTFEELQEQLIKLPKRTPLSAHLIEKFILKQQMFRKFYRMIRNFKIVFMG